MDTEPVEKNRDRLRVQLRACISQRETADEETRKLVDQQIDHLLEEYLRSE